MGSRARREKRPVVVASAGLLAVLVIAWVVVNPAGGFGVSRFGLTTFDRLPVPIFDLQVRADGSMRWLWKSHDIDSVRLDWLEASAPEVIIVGLGWSPSARVSADIPHHLARRVIALPTGEALARFNVLRTRGVKVAIHVHSTC